MTATYVNFDSLKQEADLFADTFKNNTGRPQGVSELYVKDLVPGKTALCVQATSGTVVWMRYESGGAITSGAMTPDLTFTIVVWK